MNFISAILSFVKILLSVVFSFVGFLIGVSRYFLGEIFADIIAVVHLFWIGVILASTTYIFFDKPYVKIHLILISGGLIVLLILGYCPLTRLEEILRRTKEKKFTFNNSFAAYYFNKLFRTNLSIRTTNIVMILLYIFSYISSVLILIFK